MKKIFLFILLSSFAFFSTTCGDKKKFAHVTYEGHVFNQNNNPVGGIVVVLSACKMGTSADNAEHCNCNKYEVGRATTDASGHFYIKEKAARTGRYTISIENALNYSVICATSGELSNFQTLHIP